MKLLLTSAGIKNPSIQDALAELLGKPIVESSALFVPAAVHAMPGGAEMAYRLISGREPGSPMCELGWKSLEALELTALPSIGEALWVPMVRQTDVLLVGGGVVLYLRHWMHRSGLAELLPSLGAVYVGLNAGSIVMTPHFGEEFAGGKPPTGGDEGLGMAGFSIFPHLDNADMPKHSRQTRHDGPTACGCPDTRSTMTPPSKWTTKPSKWSRKETGSGFTA